jgi:hypothetical protein
MKKNYENLDAEELIIEATRIMDEQNRTPFQKNKADKLMKLAQLKVMEKAFEYTQQPPPSERRFYRADSPEFFKIKAKVGSNYYEMDLTTEDDILVANHLLNIYLQRVARSPKPEPE